MTRLDVDAIDSAAIGKLASLLLELADMSGSQSKQYHRHQQADDENQHGLPTEPAHRIIATRLWFSAIAVVWLTRMMKPLRRESRDQAITLMPERESPEPHPIARKVTVHAGSPPGAAELPG